MTDDNPPDHRRLTIQASEPGLFGAQDLLPSQVQPADPLSSGGILSSLGSVTVWLNSPPLTANDLRGKVVLIDFWTYSMLWSSVLSHRLLTLPMRQADYNSPYALARKRTRCMLLS